MFCIRVGVFLFPVLINIAAWPLVAFARGGGELFSDVNNCAVPSLIFLPKLRRAASLMFTRGSEKLIHLTMRTMGESKGTWLVQKTPVCSCLFWLVKVGNLCIFQLSKCPHRTPLLPQTSPWPSRVLAGWRLS